jgi:energy-coupling factor transport system ATP-binding protein
MNKIISIDNLIFKYNDNIIFNHFNLDIKENKWLSIIGPNGSGKSTLAKILVGLLPYEGIITIDSLVLTKETVKEIREKTAIVFENPDNQFVSETVLDEIVFKLENLGKSKSFIKKQLDYITNLLDIKHILKKTPHELSNSDKQIVALASALINEPKILILDEALNKIDYDKKNSIYKILKELDITIINITHDMNETVLSDEIVILDNGKLIMHDKKELVLKEEKLFNKLGLEVPFMAALSIKLGYYDLVDEIVFDMEEMVDKLWK